MSTDTTRNDNDNNVATTDMLTVLKERGIIQNVAEAATVLGIRPETDNTASDSEFVPAEISENAGVV